MRLAIDQMAAELDDEMSFRQGGNDGVIESRIQHSFSICEHPLRLVIANNEFGAEECVHRFPLLDDESITLTPHRFDSALAPILSPLALSLSTREIRFLFKTPLESQFLLSNFFLNANTLNFN